MTPLGADLGGFAGAVRLSAAVAVAKGLSTGIRLTGKGGGTALPGLAAVRIDPRIVHKISRKLPEGVIVVAGTNGKTTTSRLLADMLALSGMQVVHNRSGSNLLQGVASTLAGRASFRGGPDAEIAVIEGDEAAFPEIVRATCPRMVLLTNLFRDQLDRYGELNTIAGKWEPLLRALDASATLVLNGDDPTLVSISDFGAAARVYFGINPGSYALDALPHAADAAVCRTCGADLHYAVLSVSHLGDWDCPRCGWRRPVLDVEGSDIQLKGVEALDLTVRIERRDALPLHIDIPGLYNAYNVTAAAAAAHALGVDALTISRACADFTAPFGRMERVQIANRDITLALVKNPVGFNEMLRMLTSEAGGPTIPTLIAINDLDADGRDVSWLWDVDFEMLARGNAPLATTGLRGPDMANRLKYAGVESDRVHPLETALKAGLFEFVGMLPAGGSGYVLATYTAMLELRAVLAAEGLVQSFWEQ